MLKKKNLFIINNIFFFFVFLYKICSYIKIRKCAFFYKILRKKLDILLYILIKKIVSNWWRILEFRKIRIYNID